MTRMILSRWWWLQRRCYRCRTRCSCSATKTRLCAILHQLPAQLLRDLRLPRAVFCRFVNSKIPWRTSWQLRLSFAATPAAAGLNTQADQDMDLVVRAKVSRVMRYRSEQRVREYCEDRWWEDVDLTARHLMLRLRFKFVRARCLLTIYIYLYTYLRCQW